MRRETALELLLRGLTAINVALIKLHNLPPLMESGVRYRRDEAGAEVWSNAYEVAKRGYGDCEDLSCYLAAELQIQGQPAVACVKRTGRRRLHTLVCVDGRVLDPSRALGMGRKHGR